MNARSAETADAEQAAPQGGDRTEWVSAIPFFGVHLAPLAAVFTVVTWEDWLLCAVLYLVRMFCITAGYHRYFSHRSFRAGRVVQFLLAFGGTTAVQKGPLWWAGHHRMHHRHSDLDDDIHSPRDGFWWSHVGWILSTRYKATDLAAIRDFAAYPELRLLDRYSLVGPWALGLTCFALGGWGAPADRVLPFDGPALARDLRGQLADPPLRPAAVRNVGYQPQLDADRDDHRGRGVAQQPPLPPGLGPAGVRLVGVRPDLVHPARARRPPSGP